MIVLGLCWVSVARAQGPGFTQEDRDRLIRLETTLQVFMHQVDKRFEQVDKRFEEMRQDFDKRIQELREDMNKRFEQVDKRLEQVDRRFEQVDRRFEQIMTFLWILAAIFTTLTATVIGFAYWDRRTIIRKARDEAIERIEKEGRLKDLIQAMRALAMDNPSVAEVLRRFHLL